MRSSLASLTRDEYAPPVAGRAGLADVAAKAPSTTFSREIAVAAQVFADGLAEMWAARRDPVTAQPGSGASDKRALIASLSNRVDVLALRAAAATARPGTAASFAQAATMIRDLATRRLSASPVDASGNAS